MKKTLMAMTVLILASAPLVWAQGSASDKRLKATFGKKRVPVSGEMVSLKKDPKDIRAKMQTSDDKGEAVFEDVEPGTYYLSSTMQSITGGTPVPVEIKGKGLKNLRVTVMGYESRVKTVKSFDWYDLEAKVEEAAGTVDGPMAGVEVLAVWAGNSAKVRTTANGAAYFKGVGPGECGFYYRDLQKAVTVSRMKAFKVKVEAKAGKVTMTVDEGR